MAISIIASQMEFGPQLDRLKFIFRYCTDHFIGYIVSKHELKTDLNTRLRSENTTVIQRLSNSSILTIESCLRINASISVTRYYLKYHDGAPESEDAARRDTDSDTSYASRFSSDSSSPAEFTGLVQKQNFDSGEIPDVYWLKDRPGEEYPTTYIGYPVTVKTRTFSEFPLYMSLQVRILILMIASRIK
ncbi:hypothetical protein EAI_02860 [Harpegnathos saltator]|uniref:Uncharacterized protein n=1 Tax=Harpegnathos saltator TaxID=610380 RepID=E2C6S5_HARSA|nr:hypothetical protein EAI_02860 [Harpegnathos saltator]